MIIIYYNQHYPYSKNSMPYYFDRYPTNPRYRYPSYSHAAEYNSNDMEYEMKDYGPDPFVINIDEAAKANNNFRTTLWTGDHLQLTLMSIPVGGEIGLERHPELDQFIRIEEGEGIVRMGNRQDDLKFQEKVYDDFSFIIPAGTWHNLMNTGSIPIKLYSIYAPPQHPHGTVHRTKEEAESAGHSHSTRRNH